MCFVSFKSATAQYEYLSDSSSYTPSHPPSPPTSQKPFPTNQDYPEPQPQTPPPTHNSTMKGSGLVHCGPCCPGCSKPCGDACIEMRAFPHHPANAHVRIPPHPDHQRLGTRVFDTPQQVRDCGWVHYARIPHRGRATMVMIRAAVSARGNAAVGGWLLRRRRRVLARIDVARAEAL